MIPDQQDGKEKFGERLTKRLQSVAGSRVTAASAAEPRNVRQELSRACSYRDGS